MRDGDPGSTFPSVPLVEICDWISSGGTPSRKRPDYFAGADGHPWVKSQELRDGSIWQTDEHISDAGLANSSAKYYPPQTVLVAMYGANVGQLGYLRTRSTVNQAVCGLCVDPAAADARYVFYALMHERRLLVGQAAGAAQQNLNQDLIRNFRIPLPPLATQQKITAVLSAYDDLIEQNNRRIQLLDEIARRIYREWFVDFRYPSHERVPLVESELGPIPQGWGIVPLSSVCDRITDGAHASPKTTAVGMPMASVKDMTPRRLALEKCRRISVEDYERLAGQDCCPRVNDVLIAKDGSYLKHVFVIRRAEEVVILSSIALLRPNGAIQPDILALGLRQPETKERLKGFVSGVAIPRIVVKDFRIFLIVQPPRELQEALVALIDPTLELALELDRATTSLREARDLLLPRLVTGELDISELDIAMPGAAA